MCSKAFCQDLFLPKKFPRIRSQFQQGNIEQSMKRRNLFEKRLNIKPYEYPELLEFKDAIRHSYWLHTEFNFTGDIQDYRTTISDHERHVLTRAMLAISQVEVNVKRFFATVEQGNLRHKTNAEVNVDITVQGAKGNFNKSFNATRGYEGALGADNKDIQKILNQAYQDVINAIYNDNEVANAIHQYK